jgi:sirohydrochlorin ferrochelatase
MRDILLIDNGSKRPDATLSLRGIASRLAEQLGETVHPVSLLHSHQIPPSALDGRPADTFESFLQRRLEAGVRSFVVLPLFFGPSRALGDYVPEKVSALREAFGSFEVQVARTLCPLPDGEPDLVDILLDHIGRTASIQGIAMRRVLLVDHGSPIPTVTEVRRWLAAQLAKRLEAQSGSIVELGEAVMERREGAEYDFNGELLEDRLRGLAEQDRSSPVILAMLFVSPGRHAGASGDIAQICGNIEEEYRGFRVYPSPLVGSHPTLVGILARRVAEIDRREQLNAT